MLDEQLKALGFPKASRVDRAVFKKMVLESGTLDAIDKKALKDDVGRIRWLYSLKPQTCGITAYTTDERDYGEVAVLSVELADTKRAKRVAHLLHKAIPYPLLVWLIDNNRVALSVADKRNSQADQSKWVLEDHWLGPWLSLPPPRHPETTNRHVERSEISPILAQETLRPAQGDDSNTRHVERSEASPMTEIEKAFWEDAEWSRLPATHYLSFYQGWKARVLALLCAERTGHYQREGQDPAQRIATLTTLEKLEQQRAELKNRLKKEKQMGRQVALTTELHGLNEQLARHTQQL